jgi:hypothetical protein
MYALKQHVRQHQLEVEPVRPAMVLIVRDDSDGPVANSRFPVRVLSVEAMSYGVRTIEPASAPQSSH